MRLLLVGHACMDATASGFLPGGAVTYAALLAASFNIKPRILTSFGNDFQFQAIFENTELEVIPSAQSTIFKNSYQNGQRSQVLHQLAANLGAEHLPKDWGNSDITMLCPIANEVDLNLLPALQSKIVCVCPQGWLRQWDSKGIISARPFEKWKSLDKVDIISLSENDLGNDPHLAEKIAAFNKILIVTQGKKGATVYHQGKKHFFPAFPANEIDPTGAGDVFATAFTLMYYHTNDIKAATLFAHACAALTVEKPGIGGIPAYETLKKFLATYSISF